MRRASPVEPLPQGIAGQWVACGECGSMMDPIVHLDLDRDTGRWIYWRCLGDSGHVTVALPLPR